MSTTLRLHTIVAAVLIVMLLSPVVWAGKDRKKKADHGEYVVTEAALQSELMSFADRYVSIAAQAIDDVAELQPSPEVRRLFTAELVYSSAAAYTIAADPYPQVALLDMVVMATLGRMIFEEHWLPRYGAVTEPVIAAMRDLENQAWRVADQILTAEQGNELRERIKTFRRTNPGLTTFSYLRFADFPSKRESSTLKESSGGGIFKSVRKMTDQVEQTRMLAERAMYLSTRLPLLGGFFADIWLSHIAINPAVEEVLRDVHSFAEVSERVATAAEHLPQQIADERKQTILQLAGEVADERAATVDQVFKRLALERKNTLDQLFVEEQHLTGVLAEMRQTIEAGNELTLAVDALAERLDLGAQAEEGDLNMPAEPTPPFEIEDYRLALVEAGATIRELDTVVGSIHRLVDSSGAERLLPQVTSAIDEVEGLGQKIVDRAFYRALLLLLIAIVAVVAARLCYRWLELRFFGTPA